MNNEMTSMTPNTIYPRYICIHGHFYQPPRENPWLEAIELQESADPYHDWNDRITAECYMPNSAARIQTSDGHIVGIVNNYARMSFNFGPTLLSWMDDKNPVTYQAILEADKESIERFGGHGSAMAQVYNHIIMPLANHRDKETQIIWGIRDFEQRFGRMPEGMWLAEAAVNTETLELLAEHGIKFTVLAPRQAHRVRPMADNGNDVPDVGWEDVTGGQVDPARPYLYNLPSGKSIALFFYDGPISQAVAFEGILNQGETFAERLLSGFSDERDYPQLLHIATDGETYGHHHKFGDMALAYALHYIESNQLAQLVNYGQFLELHPPTWEVQIMENSSWSCAHGVERWSSDCGCSSGMHQGWSQQWRHPLRRALDWLRDTINEKFEEVAAETYADPWAARNAYIDVILCRCPDVIDRFLKDRAGAELTHKQQVHALELMELQRQLMLMYTSCGWFFDELSGIETVQIMQYASRAIQLAEQCLGLHLEPDFVALLEEARSNIAENKNGAIIYEKYVRPAKVDLVRVGAHYAVTSMFQEEKDKTQIYAFSMRPHEWNLYDSGSSRLVLGSATITSDVTREQCDVTFSVLHLGSHNLTAGVRGRVTEDHFKSFAREIKDAFTRADLPQLIRLLDQEFFGLTFSLRSLFKDERQNILQEILRSNLEEAEAALRLVYERNAGLMRFLATIGAHQPDILQATGRFVIGAEIRRQLEDEVPSPQRLLQLVDDAVAWNLSLYGQGIELVLNNAIEREAADLEAGEREVHAMEALSAMSMLAQHLPVVNFWRAQNVIYRLMATRYPEKKTQAEAGDENAAQWVEQFENLAGELKVKIDA